MSYNDEGKSSSVPVGHVSEVVVIAGFLGSGKTTLLKRFLEWEFQRGASPQVIMSEFGDFDVDGALVADRRIGLTSITGGCACCDLREELRSSLVRVSSSKPGSRIYIECTGVADPAGILEAVAPCVEEGMVAIKKVIVVYDATRHLRLRKDNALVERQARTADFVVINKCDLAPRRQIEEAVAFLAQINPLAPLQEAVGCAIDPEEILEGMTGLTPETGTESSSDYYRSFAFLLKASLSQSSLEKWLSSLPPSVLRVKGFVRLHGRKGLFEVQGTRDQYEISQYDSPSKRKPVLVVVAHPMRTDGLVRKFQECVAAVPGKELMSHD